MSDRYLVDAEMVTRLVAAQFPHYAGLPVTRVLPGGNDNVTFRLGDELAVRLPSGPGYVASVEKERRWLPVIAPALPLPIPAEVGAGRPGEGYPAAWSIRRWIDGEPVTTAPIDRSRFAEDLAGFLVALRAAPATDGPAAGEHSFFRGASLRHYDAETRRVLDGTGLPLDVAAEALGVWEHALRTEWTEDPVWFHGDIAVGNLLARDERLAAVIDFGTCGVGDPACDVVIAWTFFEGVERIRFRDAVGLDADTWARARGWALWKALITLGADDPALAAASRSVVRDVLADCVTQ